MQLSTATARIPAASRALKLFLQSFSVTVHSEEMVMPLPLLPFTVQPRMELLRPTEIPDPLACALESRICASFPVENPICAFLEAEHCTRLTSSSVITPEPWFSAAVQPLSCEPAPTPNPDCVLKELVQSVTFA